MRINCECGQNFPLPETFFDNPVAFWRIHGHYPSVVTIVCACGSTCLMGPNVIAGQDVGRMVAKSEPGMKTHALAVAKAVIEWYKEHREHV